MILLRAFLLTILILTVTVASTAIVFWLSPELTVGAIRSATSTFSDYELELVEPRLQWSPFSFTSELLLLGPGDKTKPPVISLQGVDAAIPLKELLFGNVTTGHFTATNVTYYLAEQSSDTPLNLEALLAPLSRLPSEIAIESAHLISRNEGLWIFPLYGVKASRNTEGSMDIDAAATIAMRRVSLDARADWTSQARGHRLELSATIFGDEENSRLQATGHVDAAGPVLNYELAVQGRYENVSDFLRVFDDNAYPFAGNLNIAGTLKGDTEGYALSLEEVGLREDDAYEFTATGQLTQRGSTESNLQLSARGSALKFEKLLPLDGELAALLHRSELELDIHGSLEAPEIRRVALVLHGVGDTRLSLSSATQALRFEELEAFLTGETTNATLDGTIGNLGELLVSTGEASRDYVVATGLTQTTASFTGTAQGNMQKLRMSLQNILLSHPGYRVSGSTELLWHQEVLSAPTVEFEIYKDGVDAEIAGRGAIADILEAQGVALELKLDKLAPSPLLNTFAVETPWDLGQVSGTALLLRTGDTLRLREIDLDIAIVPEAVIELEGHGDLFNEELSADLALQLQRMSASTWTTATPFVTSPSRWEASVRLRPRYLTVLSELMIGATNLQGVASADLDRGVIDRLSLDLYTMNLHLDDFKFQRDHKDTSNPQKPTAIDSFMESLPDFPTTLTLRSGEVTGPLTQLEDLSIAVDLAQRRITLKQLDARYAGGELMLRGNIDTTVTPPAISLAGRGIRVPLGALTTDLGLQQSVSGAMSFQGGLVTRGARKEQWVQTLQGRLSTALSDVTVSGAAYDLLMSNLLAWLVKGAGEKTTTFDCSMVQFDIIDGVARSDSVYMETPRMLATGKATLDLPGNNLDVRIEPRSKSRAIQFPSAIRLRGTLEDPKISVSALQAGADLSAQALLLLPSLTLKLFGLDGTEDLNAPCETTAF